MEGTIASWKEATSYVENIERWTATREKGKFQMQHTWKQQISLDKVVKPAQKTKETLNLKREVRGEPVKPKKNVPSGQVTSRKGRSPIRIGDLQNWILFGKTSQKTEVKSKKNNKKTIKKQKATTKTQQKNKKNNKKANKKKKKHKTNGPSVGSSPGKWATTFPKSSVWDLGWGAVPTTNHFLKIYVPIQVLMQGQKPKPNWNSFLHIFHVRQIQEPECVKTRQPRLQILHAP